VTGVKDGRRKVRTALLRIDGIVESPGIFGDGDAFWVNGKQMANFIGDECIELRMGRKQISANRARLKDDPRVALRKTSDWLGIRFERTSDVAFVAELAEITAAAYRPPPGTPPKPPPSGPQLERMRRFH
jgi:hypothetical protein